MAGRQDRREREVLPNLLPFRPILVPWQERSQLRRTVQDGTGDQVPDGEREVSVNPGRKGLLGHELFDPGRCPSPDPRHCLGHHQTPHGPDWIVSLKRSHGLSSSPTRGTRGQPPATPCPHRSGSRAARSGHFPGAVLPSACLLASCQRVFESHKLNGDSLPASILAT